MVQQRGCLEWMAWRGGRRTAPGRQQEHPGGPTHPLPNLVHVVCQKVPHGRHVFRGKPLGSLCPLGPGSHWRKAGIISPPWQGSLKVSWARGSSRSFSSALRCCPSREREGIACLDSHFENIVSMPFSFYVENTIHFIPFVSAMIKHVCKIQSQLLENKKCKNTIKCKPNILLFDSTAIRLPSQGCS